VAKSLYEQERKERIAENRKRLVELGLERPASAKQPSQPGKKRARPEESSASAAGPSRGSDRLVQQGRVDYVSQPSLGLASPSQRRFRPAQEQPPAAPAAVAESSDEAAAAAAAAAKAATEIDDAHASFVSTVSANQTKVTVYIRAEPDARFLRAFVADGQGIRLAVAGSERPEIVVRTAPQAVLNPKPLAKQYFEGSGVWSLEWALSMPASDELVPCSPAAPRGSC